MKGTKLLDDAALRKMSIACSLAAADVCWLLRLMSVVLVQWPAVMEKYLVLVLPQQMVESREMTRLIGCRSFFELLLFQVAA